MLFQAAGELVDMLPEASEQPAPLDEVACDWCGAYASRPAGSGSGATPWWWVEDGEQVYCSAKCRHEAAAATK